MKPVRKLNRRSFLGRVAGGAVAAGGALGLIGGARAGQVTDSDMGPGSDPLGQGRGGSRPGPTGVTDPAARAPGGRTGVTDSDSGRYSDAPGYGRRRSPPRVTDRDTGRYSDLHGRGRRAPAVTDRDTGRYGDPAGRGRGGSPRASQGVTDSDTGPGSDPIGYGRGQRQGAIPDAARQQCQADRARLDQLEREAGGAAGWSPLQVENARESLGQLYSIQNQATQLYARRQSTPSPAIDAEIVALEGQYRQILRANNMAEVPINAGINELTNRIRLAEQSIMLRRSLRERNCP